MVRGEETYKAAGVDIEAGNELVRRITPLVRKSFRKEVLTDIGGFGGLFAFDKNKYENPILVSGTDGVGTKLKVAFMMNKHDTIGIDLVAMCANDVLVTDGPDDTGKMFERPGRPSDRFRSPYANEQAARAANNGALPPDLSVIAKARAGGPDYIYSLLTGYAEPPSDMEMSKGMQYNAAFPGHQIAMPNPLVEGVVEYTDGTAPTVDNYAKDVSAFLMWTAEPKLEERYKIGARMMIFLFVFAVIMYLSKRAVWARLHRRDHQQSA